MFTLTQEQMDFKRNVREFVEKEVQPTTQKLDTSAKFPYQIIKRCGELGFLDTLFSQSSSHMETTRSILFLEEISRGLGSLGLILCPHFQGITLLSTAACDSLKSEILPQALTGEKVLAYAISEESGGTNALGISTTAVRDSDSWIINGKKCWITNAGAADGYFITAQTASTSRKRSISFFYIDSNNAGVILREPSKMIGCNNSIMRTVLFNDCRIPANCLIGTENEGYPLMKETLNLGRLGISAVATGISQRALELAIEFSESRTYYGRKLSSNQGISFPISEMYAYVSALKNMLYHTAALSESGKSYTVEVSALKIIANEICRKICQKAQEIHGAYGLSKGSEIERCLRDSYMMTSAEGTTQACKMAISSALFNSPLEQYF